MDNHEQLFEDIKEIADRISGLYDLAYVQYVLAVEEVLAGKLTEEKEIEQILDGIINFSDDIRFLELSKKLCRHIYFQYPQLLGDYVNIYSLLYTKKEAQDDLCDV